MNQLLAIMEMDGYSPGGSMVTTDANRTASKKMRQLLLAYCKKDAAHLWTNKNDYVDKGFEMITAMNRKYVPNTKQAIFMWYMTLFTIKQEPNESITVYTSRIREAYANLKSGGVQLDPMVLTLLCMHGLGDDYMTLKKDMALNTARYVDKGMDDLEEMAEEWVRISSQLDPLSESAGPSAASAHRIPDKQQPPPAAAKIVYPPTTNQGTS